MFTVILIVLSILAQAAFAAAGEFSELTAERLLSRPVSESHDIKPLTLFMERSNVFLDFTGIGTQGQVLEAQIAPHLFPYQKGASARDLHYGGWFYNGIVTPMVRVRILKERSAPVRTPSFMPKGTAQFIHLLSRRPGLDWGRRGARLLALQAAIGHHSNGQDGCTFEGTDPPDCEGFDMSALRINRINGSYSTNYGQAAVHYRKMWLEKFAMESNARRRVPTQGGMVVGQDCRVKDGYYVDECWWEPSTSLSLSVKYEHHPTWSWPGGMLDPVLAPFHGKNRVELRVEAEVTALPGIRRGRTILAGWMSFSDKTRDTVDCGIAADPAPCAERWGWGAELIRQIDARNDLAIFARYHHAQDYYNLGFPRNYNEFQVGLSFDPGRVRVLALRSVDPVLLEEEKPFQHGTPEWRAFRNNTRTAVRCRRGILDPDSERCRIVAFEE